MASLELPESRKKTNYIIPEIRIIGAQYRYCNSTRDEQKGSHGMAPKTNQLHLAKLAVPSW